MDFIEELNWETASNDISFFMTDILGYKIKDFHQEWMHKLLTEHRTCTICAREHGKSIAVSLVYPLWINVFNPVINQTDIYDNNDVFLISNSLNQSQELIKRITNIIETNDYFSTINFKNSTQTKIEIREKENNNRIQSFAFGSAIRGRHPRVAIVDDPLSEQGTYSDQTIHDIFFSAITPIIKHDGYIHVVGTPFAYDDLYSYIKKAPKYVVNTYPAIRENGEALWPEHWSLEQLADRRLEMGDWLFTREYLCNPIDESTSIFPTELVNSCIDVRKIFGGAIDPTARYVMGVDFSIGTKSSADYSVAIVIKDDMKGNLSIVDIWRKQNVDYDEQVEAIIGLYNRYKPTKILVEDNVFQAIFKQILAKRFLPVSGYTTTRKSKEQDIFKLHSLMENRILSFPYGNPWTIDLINRLKLELLAFGYKNGKLEARIGHDDMVMSLAIAIHAATNFPAVDHNGSMYYHSKADAMLGITGDMNIDLNSQWSDGIISKLGI